MADWFNKVRDGYQGAMSVPQTDAATRLILAMSGGNKPKPNVPNYSAIPLNPFNIPYTGPTNELPKPPMPTQAGPLPPFQPPGTTAQAVMPDRGLPSLSPPRQDNYGDAPKPMPTMPPVTVTAPAPTGADAAYVPPPMDPRTMGDADMAGYGGSPRLPAVPPPGQYSHLNPTPGLEEIFRREYAANPGAFGKLFG